MSPKGRRHEVLRSVLAFMLSRQCPGHLMVATETPLNLAADYAPEPDIIVFPASLKAPDVDGKSVLLVIEIADTSLAYDLTTKPAIYASHNVREYWVINANTLDMSRFQFDYDLSFSTMFFNADGTARFSIVSGRGC